MSCFDCDFIFIREQGKENVGGDLRRRVRLILAISFLLLTGLHFPSVRERLKEVLRQYELRERHFECVIRSKELEVLLSRARAEEQKQLAKGEKIRSERADVEVMTPPFWLFYLCADEIDWNLP